MSLYVCMYVCKHVYKCTPVLIYMCACKGECVTFVPVLTHQTPCLTFQLCLGLLGVTPVTFTSARLISSRLQPCTDSSPCLARMCCWRLSSVTALSPSHHPSPSPHPITPLRPPLPLSACYFRPPNTPPMSSIELSVLSSTSSLLG